MFSLPLKRGLSVTGPGRENAASKAIVTGRRRARHLELRLVAGPGCVLDPGYQSAAGRYLTPVEVTI